MGKETGDDVKKSFKIKYKSDDVQRYFGFSSAPVNLMSNKGENGVGGGVGEEKEGIISLREKELITRILPWPKTRAPEGVNIGAGILLNLALGNVIRGTGTVILPMDWGV